MTRSRESQATIVARGFSRMQRLKTGNREADEILNGGFPTNSINVIMGQPGTGKTIFVQSLAWHNARGGRPVAYCTTLAEPLSKLVRYLQELDFFDSLLVGSSVVYEDLGEAVASQGLEGLTQSVREVIKTRRPAVLIVDSFKSAQELGGSERDVRRMTFELAGLLSAYDVTTFLVGEYHEGDVRKSAVFAAADGIVELMRVADDRRDERYLRVLKLRGSDYRSGLHGFTITSRGLSIYPRLVTRDDRAESGPQNRSSTGIPGLDALTGGGILDAGQTLLLGSPGAGKTTMAMQFLLEGARKREPCLFISLRESKEQLERLIRRLDPGLGESERANVEIGCPPPLEFSVDRVVSDVLLGLGRRKPKRVAVDNIGDLVTASPRRTQHDCVDRLLQWFSSNGATSILTGGRELGRDDATAARILHIADNVIVAEEYPGSPDRLCIRVRKCRFSSHERSSRFLELGGRGARVAE